MPRLYVAANYINNLHLISTLASIANRSLGEQIGPGHLQFVYDDGSGGPLEELEVQSTNETINGPWVFEPVRPHGGASAEEDETDGDHTTSIDVNDVITNHDRYARVEIPLREGQTAAGVWELLKNASLALREHPERMGATINYDINQNSNSFVKTLLEIAGVDAAPLINSLVVRDIKQFPGSAWNILNGVELSDGYDGPIPIELEGTLESDYIQGGIDSDIITGRLGDDTIHGSMGDDELYGDDGEDIIYGGGHNDLIEEGDNDDTIY